MSDLRCTTQTAQLGEPPAGSMGGDDRYVLVELPMPWPKKIDEHPDLPSFTTKGRVLAIASAEPSDLLTVICYDRPDDSLPGFTRHETTVPATDLEDVFVELQTDDFTRFDSPSAEANEIVDVLICAHGSRDRCCGQFGARLFLDLIDRQGDGDWDERVRVWRTSHIGGHRFAPTAMTFPDAMGWAWLDLDAIVGIADRSLQPADAAAMARGSGAMPNQAAQLADVRGLARHGWAWLDAPRRVTVESSTDRDLVSLESSLGTATIELRHAEPIPVPTCGEADSTKSTRQLEVVSETWFTGQRV